MVQRNRQQLAEVQGDIQGRPLAELAAAARRTLVQQALAYTGQYRDVPSSLADLASSAGAALVLSGHQPELVHPGVWYKNFLLGQLADRIGGVGIHLLIDSDLCRVASIRVPTGTPDEPRVESVPVDEPAAEVPYEERVVVDRETLKSFSQRVTKLMSRLVPEPIVNRLWPHVLESHSAQPNLGLCLAQGRHQLEAEWGNVTLELPQTLSANCRSSVGSRPTCWRICRGFGRPTTKRWPTTARPTTSAIGPSRFPIWLRATGGSKRRSGFGRPTIRSGGLCSCEEDDRLLVTDRERRTVDLSLTAEGDAAAAAEQLADLAERGVKIRTRALATTLFARLCLSDLFLHGIGGAKYDQVTDAIAERFFGFALPALATVSATLRLPIDHRHADKGEQRALVHELRDLEFHPERFAPRDGSASGDAMSDLAELAARKQRWIDTPKTEQNVRQRHQEITAANEAIYPHVAHLRTQIERQLNELQRRTRASAILESREYAFCLFPREPLARLLLDASQ